MPTWPGTLVIDLSIIAAEVGHKKEGHKELVLIYRNCKNVEKALLRNIKNTVEDKYIKHLINEDTGLIKDDIPTVLD